MARILTVDDEPLICRQIERVLSKYGHEVHQFHSGQEALEAMRKMEFDLDLKFLHLFLLEYPLIIDFDFLSPKYLS